MKWLCVWLIRMYQRFISPLKGRPTCRFTPSCSAYAVTAFQKRGFFVGMYLTVRRILRCNPFVAGGYDPVPEKGIPFRSKPSVIRENDSDKETQPKLICEDYVLRRPHKEPGSMKQTTPDTTRD